MALRVSTGGVKANFSFVDCVNSMLAWLVPVDWYNYLPTDLQILHKVRNIFPFYQWYKFKVVTGTS